MLHCSKCVQVHSSLNVGLSIQNGMSHYTTSFDLVLYLYCPTTFSCIYRSTPTVIRHLGFYNTEEIPFVNLCDTKMF